MNLFIYDNTFEGLLSAINDALDLKIIPDKIVSVKSFQDDLFANKYEITTDSDKFDKIWNSIKKNTSEQHCQKIYKAYLSELQGVEKLIYEYVKLVLDASYYMETHIGEDVILKLNSIQKKVGKEAQRVLSFLQFRKTIDDINYAAFDSKYNVIPLTVTNLQSRFLNQKWLLFDTHRKFGYYYNLEAIREITIVNKKINLVSGKVDEDLLRVSEKLFQKLWKTYYNTINDRKNLKINMQFLTERFWEYLPENDFKGM